MEPVEGAAMPISSLPSMENSTRTEPNCSPGNSGRIEPPADGPLANLSSFRQTASTNKRAAYSYAYRGDGDAFAQGVSQNLPRIRKQQLDPNARGSVPLIARNIEVYNALIKAREDHLTRFGDAVQAADKALTQLGEFLPRETSRKQELAKKGPGDPQSASKLAHIQARIDLAQERQLKWLKTHAGPVLRTKFVASRACMLLATSTPCRTCAMASLSIGSAIKVSFNSCLAEQNR